MICTSCGAPAMLGHPVGLQARATDHAARRQQPPRVVASRMPSGVSRSPRTSHSVTIAPPARAHIGGVGVGHPAEVHDGRVGRVDRGDPGGVRLQLAQPFRPDPLQPRHPVGDARAGRGRPAGAIRRRRWRRSPCRSGPPGCPFPRSSRTAGARPSCTAWPSATRLYSRSRRASPRYYARSARRRSARSFSSTTSRRPG